MSDISTLNLIPVIDLSPLADDSTRTGLTSWWAKAIAEVVAKA